MAEKSEHCVSSEGRVDENADDSSSSSVPAPAGHIRPGGLFEDSERKLYFLDNTLDVDVTVKRRNGLLRLYQRHTRWKVNHVLNADNTTDPRYVIMWYKHEGKNVTVKTAAFLSAADDGFNIEIEVEGALTGRAMYFSPKNCFWNFDSLLNYTLRSDRIDVYNEGKIFDDYLFTCYLK